MDPLCPKCGCNLWWDGVRCGNCQYEVNESATDVTRAVHFLCPWCGTSLSAPVTQSGQAGLCPHCSAKPLIPALSEPVSEISFNVPEPLPEVLPRATPVPITVTFPTRIGGGVQTHVSQETADMLAKVAVCGAIVLGGIALWVLCPPAAAALTAVAAGAAGKCSA